MNYTFYPAIFLSLFVFSLCQQCPPIYMRYSLNHSFCQPKNNTCAVYHSGVTDAERRQIVDFHNKYRSMVATGKESRAGGLPQAADMMQMVWDKELAAVAQRRAEHCVYEHDCNDCRRVENFPVGQNIAYREMTCPGATNCPLNYVPNWFAVIKMFYDEVSMFNKQLLSAVRFPPGKEIGHFTQMIWAKTWRIGCGYVAFRKGNGYRQFYVCNYGPAGNNINTPVYKAGTECTSCPLNSCCGKTCKRASYAGLCRMNRNNEAPIYRMDTNNIFYCDFRSPVGDCSHFILGINKWKFVKALGGSFAEIVLNGGESSTLKLKKFIRPKQNFCLLVMYRAGPVLSGLRSSSALTVTFEVPNAPPNAMNLPNIGNSHFFEYRIDLNWKYDTMVSFTFTVPKGAPAQFFNLGLVKARNGRCS